MTNQEINEKINSLETKILDILSFGVLDTTISSLEEEIKKIQDICPHEETVVEGGKIFCAFCHKYLDEVNS